METAGGDTLAILGVSLIVGFSALVKGESNLNEVEKIVNKNFYPNFGV